MNGQELYHKLAADYDCMAREASDPAIQGMYLEFARQWRAAAEKRRRTRSLLAGSDHQDVVPLVGV